MNGKKIIFFRYQYNEGLASLNSIGTSAHELCFNLNKPVQILGPENYCYHFHKRTASAAPIFDSNNKILAALVILNPPIENISQIETNTLASINSMALASTCSIVAAIESRIRNYSDKSSSPVYSTLRASLDLVDEGAVVVDKSGMISQANRKARKILKIKSDQIGQKNIKESLVSHSSIFLKAENGKKFIVEEYIQTGSCSKKQLYRITGSPILNQHTHNLDTIILKFTSCHKIVDEQSILSDRMASCTFSDILGKSEQIKTAISQAQRISNYSENLVLIGESGTGKELFAQAIHNAYRPQGPFIAINCAALPRELIGSELFGYEGGSFTGADQRGKPGKIELSHGGTLFLDEIGDMPLDLQATLLRTLEDKKVMRIGGSEYKRIHFRLIAATNKDLVKMVKRKQFREDLFFRIAGCTFLIPPLRERRGDIDFLSRFFLERFCSKYGAPVPEISKEVRKFINKYSWPGNIRELQNAIQHAANTAEEDIINICNLPYYILNNIEATDFKKKAGTGNLCLKDIEKQVIEEAIKLSNHNISIAADSVGVSRATLYRKMKKYQIDIPE